MRLPSIDRITGIAAAAMIVAAPPAYTASRDVMGMEYAAFYWIAACALLTAMQCISRIGKSSALRISAADTAVAAYLIYCYVNGTAKGGTDPLIIWRWSAVAAGYLLTRMLRDRGPLTAGITISALVQTVLAILQKAGMATSNHMLFAVTGSFGNPGQLGGFLAVGFAVSLSLAVMSAKSGGWSKYIHIASTATIAAGLILADSRAGFIGAAAAAAYIFRKEIASALRRPAWAAAAVAALLAITAALFAYRPGSASARLLIWRITAEMAADAPLTGHGPGAFNREYLDYQGRYFAARPDSPFIIVADNAGYAYNEALHLVAEEGVIGLVLAALLLALLFAYPQRASAGRTALCGLAAWGGFAMFSYPASTLPTMLLLGILVGTPRSRTLLRLRMPRALPVIVAVAALAAGAAAIKGHRFYAACDEPAFVDAHFERIRLNPQLCNDYMSRLADSGLHSRLTVLSGQAFPSTGMYCNIGAAYERSGDRATAEEYYLKAADIIPTRFTPRYRLWELYLHSGDTTKAAAEARRLLSMPLKIENTFTLRKKGELREFLNRTVPAADSARTL